MTDLGRNGRRAKNSGRRQFPALLAGQVASAMMALLLAPMFLSRGGSPLTFFHLVGATFLGDDAFTHPGLPGLFLGALVHQAGVGLWWSALYGFLAQRARVGLDISRALLLGFFVGGTAEIFDVRLLMPALQSHLNGKNLWAANLDRPWDWAAHLAFGLTLGLFYVLSCARAARPRVLSL